VSLVRGINAVSCGTDAFGDSGSDESKLLVGHVGRRYFFDALFENGRDRMSYRRGVQR
jgi:hypothetical protein